MRGGASDLATEDLHRRPPGSERDALLARMDALGADLIVPVRHHGQLSGLLALAPRLSGRLYGATGRTTLRLIAEQLGVAVANARLYTEARRSQAYNQFLVEHLSCGVIATDPVGNLSVVNPEARRILHLDELAPPAEIELPADMASLIAPTLEGDTIARNEEIILRPGARDQAHIRVSCLPFASETNELLGAVLVINDHTTLEQLQRAGPAGGPPRQHRHAGLGHGARDQEPAHGAQDVHPVVAQTLQRRRVPARLQRAGGQRDRAHRTHRQPAPRLRAARAADDRAGRPARHHRRRDAARRPAGVAPAGERA